MIYILSPEARSDFKFIFYYSLSTWGEAQALSYRKKLEDGLKTIAANPRIGREKPDGHCFQVGSHVIVYRIENSGINILRILHNQDPLTQFLISES